MATTINVYTTNDDSIKATSGTYSTAHDAASGTITTGAYMYIGQYFAASVYGIERAFLQWDTSSISSAATIISATLRIKVASFPAKDFNVVIKNGQPTYPHATLEVGDYNDDNYSGDGGSINTAGMINNTYYIINITELSWITKEGTTKLALFGSNDINSVVPDATERLIIWSYFAGGGAQSGARLQVTYAVEGYPSATTQAATNVKDVSVKGNGTLTDGGVATEWGFEYGLTETPTWKVSKVINIEESAFSLNINGLEPSTTYYYRAYATNSYGTAYGSWTSFTTKVSASYDVYTEPNTAKYRLYVSDDEAIAWRGYKGPYSGKQTLINISDITNKTKGVKVLKVDLPDANTKGNFHICITVKQTLKG